MSIGLFCVHGFLESGYGSYKYLTEFLDRHDIQNYYLTDLQGHSEEEDIDTFNYKLCLSQVEEEYLEYKSKHDKVYVIGFSMGGVIAAHLASKHGVDKLVLVSPAFKYGNSSQIFNDLRDIVKIANKDEHMPSIFELFKYQSNKRKEIITTFVNMEYETRGASYENFMLRLSRMKPQVFINFTRLVATVRKTLKIPDNLPVRIYHAENDELVPLDSSLYIFRRIKSDHKRLIIVSGVRHRILASHIRDDVFTEIKKFLYE